MRSLILTLLIPLIVIAANVDINSLVKAEHDFSKMSVEKGLNASFVNNFSDEAIIFRPTPVFGKEWYEKKPASQGELSWRPTLSEIASSGELGYNTGPWEFREKAGMKPVGYGQFFSFWKKQKDGNWKVVFDHGYDHPMSETNLKLETILPEQKPATSDRPQLEKKLMMEQDRLFSKMCKELGIEKAFAQFLSQKTRVMRPGHLPESNREKALALIAQESGSLTWEASGGDVSASSALGYVYGLSERQINGKTEKGNYIRAWRKERDGWKVAVDLMTPFPPEK